MNARIAVVFFLALLLNSTKASVSKIDSLKLILNKSSGREKAIVLNTLAFEYLYKNRDSAMKYGLAAQVIAKKGNFQSDLANSFNNIGMVFFEKGDFENALNSYIQADKIFEKEKDKLGIFLATTNMGRVYEQLNLLDKALAQYLIALKVADEIDNAPRSAEALANIGSLYYSKDDKGKALEYFSKSLEVNKQMNNVIRIMEGLNNVAVINQELGNYNQALTDFRTFLNFSKKNKDNASIIAGLHNIGLVYKDQKDFINAIAYIDSSIAIAKQIKDFDNMREIYSSLSEIYKEQKNYEKAFECFQLSAAAKDSLQLQTREKQFIEMSTKYETEKKDAENKVLKAEGQMHKTIAFAVAGGLLLVIALAFFIFRNYRNEHKANLLLEAQNTEITEKKHIIEEKQKEILDSITYAKRLQEAILPPAKFMNEHLPEHFLYYRPKDIVAGDFYWMEEIKSSKQSNCVLIAAADCTGHGVPGAMVSVVCSTALNRCVNEFGLTEPGKILDKARELVLETFSKSDRDVKDGMDISLCAISPAGGGGQRPGVEVRWSGANNPLWYIQNGEMKEITADKQPIGSTEKPQPFTTHTIELNKGDSLFLFTDGLADQFGGPKGKKFKYKKFNDILLKNHSQPPSKQKEILNTEFENWLGNLEQIDDVCVIGIRV